ncbi:MAG: gliding motility protein GldM [Bacteroidetes bacterium]|nr:gliding motility protein GldM [Bacteroidota bacterium]MDA1224148.1 gliding motility protein GldM [Bacteroidota bacterium]
MAGGKLSPRQKMINMMYLVLTALLALNVSKEIIKAFNLIENSLDNSTKNIVQKNSAVLSSLVKTATENKAAAAAVSYCNQVQGISKTLIIRLNGIKNELLLRSGDQKDPKMGRKQEPEAMLVKGGVAELAQGDNMELHAHYFMIDEGGKNGVELQASINKTRVDMLVIMKKASMDPILSASPETKKILLDRMKAIEEKTSLYANNTTNSSGTEQTWVSMYLEHSPLAGVFAMLSKVENDSRSMEAEVMQALAESVNAADYKFDKLIPVVSSATSAILTNQMYEANILLAAYNTKAQMIVTVNGRPIEVVDGVGKYNVTSSSPGSQKYKVGIQVPKPNGGGSDNYETEAEYSVFAPQAAISADELNVLYVGLPNPISVSVGGVDPKNVTVSVVGGGVNLRSAKPGQFNALVPVRKGNDCLIKVTAKLPDGRTVSMGDKKFKIRNVPRPVFKAGSVGFSGPISLSALKVQSNAVAALDNFVYDGVKYVVLSYRFTCIGRRTNGPKIMTANGASLRPIQAYLKILGPGDLIQFDQIKAIGPDKTPKFLDNVGGAVQ